MAQIIKDNNDVEERSEEEENDESYYCLKFIGRFNSNMKKMKCQEEMSTLILFTFFFYQTLFLFSRSHIEIKTLFFLFTRESWPRGNKNFYNMRRLSHVFSV